MMPPDRFSELKADIEAHGLREPITLCEGMVLDGRNRLRACQELGIPPATRDFDGNPWAYVWSLNGQRRDLSQDQRAQIWVFVAAQSQEWEETRRRVEEEANARRREKAKAQPRTEKGFAEKPKDQVADQSGPQPARDRHPTRKAKAEAAAVKPASIARAQALASERPDLAEKVRKGEIKPAEARRQAKKDTVAGKIKALPKGLFTVIYADPPWSCNDRLSGDISENYEAAEKHYPTMSLAELKAMSIPAAPDAVLFLWSTVPLLPEALDLAKAWGFSYK